MIWEISTIRDSVEEQNATIGPGLFDPAKEVFVKNTKYFKRLGITCMLFIFQNFMGIQSINYYSPKIFESVGVKGTNATLFSSGMFGVVKFICTFIYILFIVDNYGRRKAFMASAGMCSICFWYVGAYLKINDPTKPGVSPGPGGKAAIGFMFIWTASFILAWSGGPFVWGAEVYEQNIRTFVQSINAAISWVPIFIMTRLTTEMINSMKYGIFLFFASIAAIAVPFVYFFVPETKGIALEDIDKLFEKGLSAHRAHKHVMSQSKPMIELRDGSQFFAEEPKKNKDEQIEDTRFSEQSSQKV